jgi:hypothetical protein
VSTTEHDDRSGQQQDHHEQGQGGSHHSRGMYLRFGAMILTAMVVMYFTMFVGSWQADHVRFSQSRVFMAMTMGGTMGLIMLGWMLNMYKSTKVNAGIVIASLLLFAGGTVLDRSQATVGDSAFMSAMIPHHSLAITRSERSELQDVRVCELAVEISEAQRREIAEMEWLIQDIAQNGIAETPEEAQEREVPEFEGSALRECASMP